MFGKLLKYDRVSVARIWGFLAVGVLAVSVFGSVLFRFVSYAFEHDMPFFGVVGMLFLVVCVIAVISSVPVTQILCYIRFYKNFFTDEGYLTFTLPVKRRTLLLAKTVNALLWSGLHILLLLVCGLIVITFAPPPEKGHFFNFIVWEGLLELLSGAWEELGVWLIVYLLEVLLMVACSLVYSFSLVHYCITVGAVLAKKHKLLAAIGIYYIANMISQFLIQFAIVLGSMYVLDGLVSYFETASPFEVKAAAALILLIVCTMAAAPACTVYCMTLGNLERKLNLA